MTDVERHPGWRPSVIVAATIAALAAMFVATPHATALRDRHATPAHAVIMPTVVVSYEGKLFHDPRCLVIHRPMRLEAMAAAVEQHFVPCPRCLGTLRIRMGF